MICVAWPYANGPLHLGHVAGCYLPPDIQARFERARGNKVLMVSGSDEHGTPITVTAEQEGVSPQDIVDKFHKINSKALILDVLGNLILTLEELTLEVLYSTEPQMISIKK